MSKHDRAGRIRSAVVLTIYDPNPNMGNQLQMYATQQILKRVGVEPVTVQFRRRSRFIKTNLKWLFHTVTGCRFSRRPEFWYCWPQVQEQYRNFEGFGESYIVSKKITNISDVPDADYYVIGSDQVWNPTWWNDDQPELAKQIYLGSFVDPEKLVCISPSFGLTRIPDEWNLWFKDNLPRIPSFNVREEEGRKIIQEYTGKDAIVTIDPTLMFDKNVWLKVARRPRNKKLPERYILTYFLGGQSDSVEREIRQYADELQAHVVHLFDYTDREYLSCGPSEFIYLMENATLVLTDSFHACVFSFLFGKPFLAYDRSDMTGMSSRMATLFRKFDLERKQVSSHLSNELLECNYTTGYQRLVVERQVLQEYLTSVMHLPCETLD